MSVDECTVREIIYLRAQCDRWKSRFAEECEVGKAVIEALTIERDRYREALKRSCGGDYCGKPHLCVACEALAQFSSKVPIVRTTEICACGADAEATIYNKCSRCGRGLRYDGEEAAK